MKLQEAFMERNDIKKRISRVQSELNTVIVTEEGEKPQFDPQEKLKEILDLHEKLINLNIKIDIANQINISTLHEIRKTDALISNYESIRSTLLVSKKKQTIGFGDTIVQMKRNFDLEEITSKLEELENQRRLLDKKLQKSNWEIEI